jgi:hypothetical protein
MKVYQEQRLQRVGRAHRRRSGLLPLSSFRWRERVGRAHHGAAVGAVLISRSA